MDQIITLRTGAWFGDAPLELSFPAGWEPRVLEAQGLRILDAAQIGAAIARPIGTPPLRELAYGRQRAAILVDDLTRPTPAGDLLPPILAELHAAGLPDSAIMIVIAGGTHAPASADEIARKIGPELALRYQVIAHDAGGPLHDLGLLDGDLPLAINAAVAECDLKIGVGCIYPHPAAGFSGGAKILMPGVCGAETTRMMHDYLRGATGRGGSLDTELRRVIEQAAARAGFDYIVNVVLTAERGVGGLFAGDRTLAHEAGVAFFKQRCMVPAPGEAEIVIADMYPFDTSLQFAYDRGLWPLLDLGGAVSRVAIAACPQGVGGHTLYPVDKPLLARVVRRLRHLRPADLRSPLEKLRTIVQLLRHRRSELLVLAPGVTADGLAQVLPRATHFAAWAPLRAALERRHGAQARVAIYRCAPLHLPEPARSLRTAHYGGSVAGGRA